MLTAITVTIRAHPVNAWFLRLLACAVIILDGTERTAGWSQPQRIPVAPGRHTLAAGLRYRGTPWLLGAASSSRPIIVPADEGLIFLARNGPLNHQPFRFKEIGRARTLHYPATPA